jgi:hypothetical protein
VPRIALHVGLLRGVPGERLISPAGQLAEPWDQLTGIIDTIADTITDLADLDRFTGEVRRLYGFDVTGVDCDRGRRDRDPLAQLRDLTPYLANAVRLDRCGGAVNSAQVVAVRRSIGMSRGLESRTAAGRAARTIPVRSDRPA